MHLGFRESETLQTVRSVAGSGIVYTTVYENDRGVLLLPKPQYVTNIICCHFGSGRHNCGPSVDGIAPSYGTAFFATAVARKKKCFSSLQCSFRYLTTETP